ncbi:MAG: alkaline phosphatase family protein [Thermoanaerobaculia bacterium]|nr:alkaline phosphatase family protein [Thermoanaerobaculia bacterium]
MKETLTLAVFIDALGWELEQQHGFLNDVLTFKKPLDTVFGYSSTCDPTILTGRPPHTHGHFAFYTYAPGNGAFPRSWRHLALLPESITSRGRVRHWLSRIGQRWLGWDGYFSLYNVPFDRLHGLDYTEKKDLYRSGGILGGQPTFLDAFRSCGVVHHVSDWRRREKDNLELLKRSLVQEAPSFAYLYLADLDGLLHAHGTGAPQIAAKLAEYESGIRELLDLSQDLYRRVRLLVFSDHGMRDVEVHSDLMERVEALPLEWGRDYGSVFDSTMARFWFESPSARRQVVSLLEAEEHGSIVEASELRRWGCDFSAARYGELFFLLRPGALFVPSDLGARPLAAMHGYAPEDPASTAFFGSNERPAPEPVGLADLATVMVSGTAAESYWEGSRSQYWEVAA